METTLTTQDPPPEPPPPSSPNAPRRLYRSPKGILGGVAAGMAGYFNVDPVLVRLLFVVSLFAGIGPLAYLVCWVVIPRAPQWPIPGYGSRAKSRGESAVSSSVASGLLIVALAALVGTGFDGIADLVLPAGLLGFGVYLLNQRGQETSTAESFDTQASEASVGATVPERPQKSSQVTPIVLSLLALTLGLALALQAAGWIAVSVSGLAAVGLVGVGLGLLASIRLGRAPGLIALGCTLLAVLLASSVAEPWVAKFDGSQANWSHFDKHSHVGVRLGEQHQVPHSLAELQGTYNHGIGDFTLDLRQLQLHGETREVRVHLGIGELKILLPLDMPAEVYGSVGLGEAGALESGVTEPTSGSLAQTGKLILRYHVGIGEGSVRRGS